MDSNSIVAFLGYLQAKRIQVRGKWVSSACPLASWNHDTGKDTNPSFAIRVEPNKESYFNCFSCESGTLGDLVVKLQYYKAQNLGYDLEKAWELVQLEADQKLNLTVKDWGAGKEEQQEYIIPESWLESFQKAWPVPYAREYLHSRMVSESICNALDLRWDRSLRTVCFPIRNKDGELVSLRGRRIKPGPDQPSYHLYSFMGHTNTRVWLGSQYVDYDRPVLVSESVFDLTSCLRVYDNVICPMTVGFSAETLIDNLGKASEVVTLFDQGKGGDKARAMVTKHLKGTMITNLVPWPYKDAGEMPEKDLRNLLKGVLNIH